MNVTVCKPNVEFVVTVATAVADAVCAPVATVDMFFSPAIVLGDEDANGTALQDAIVGVIVNRTSLKYALLYSAINPLSRHVPNRASDVLNVILSSGRRRAAGNTVDSVQTTFRTVDNAASVQAEVDQGLEIMYDGKITKVRWLMGFDTSRCGCEPNLTAFQVQSSPLTTRAPVTTERSVQVRSSCIQPWKYAFV